LKIAAVAKEAAAGADLEGLGLLGVLNSAGVDSVQLSLRPQGQH